MDIFLFRHAKLKGSCFKSEQKHCNVYVPYTICLLSGLKKVSNFKCIVCHVAYLTSYQQHTIVHIDLNPIPKLKAE